MLYHERYLIYFHIEIFVEYFSEFCFLVCCVLNTSTMRFLTRLFASAKVLPGRPRSMEGRNIEQRWEKPISSMKELLLNQKEYFFMPIGILLFHYMQYVNDVHMVELVQYDVKLYPEKPVVRRLRM